MKTLFLIRHAKSSWSDNTLKDIDRPLGNRGERDAPFMAQLLKGKGVEPNLIVSSPANRAFSTASHFATTFGIEQDKILVIDDIYDAYPQIVLDIINGLDNQHNVVLLFGHNPTFTSIANMFTEEYIANVPTCGIVKIDAYIEEWAKFSDATARKSAFYFPKQYFN